MTVHIPPGEGAPLVRIEPDDRLVVLARTLQAPDPAMEGALGHGAGDGARFGDSCLGQALYRHRALFRNAADAPVWSHLALSYFRGIVPAAAIHELVMARPPAETGLLRAEILLTTPAAFVLPRGWQGTADRPERQASLEYIEVQPAALDAYRDVMRRYIGPAAATLVRANRIGTFRTMETAAVLYQAPELTIGWNQIHLCEVEADGFAGFGAEFDAALREIAPDGGFAGVFADLDRIRTVRRWTFNDPVVEADAALGRQGLPDPGAADSPGGCA
ncbi:hypothetical protein [Aquabacter spiritensis]|uniref:EthD domain-containing protein n=1 Tax=Aquabacter spiritensis TaxID=933073 RepID=A0A4R3LU52_9HYPH|nr:hypothetical protein [Aquabacter spiritensis]TCT03506.1 hypothetical protein EDC64_10956 [Aquabacter spiritensis]